MKIKHILTIIVFGLIFCFGATSLYSATGFQAPDFEATDINTGKSVKFSEFTKDSVTVLVFWINESYSNILQVRVLSQLGKKYKNNKNVKIVSVPWLILEPEKFSLFKRNLGPFHHTVLGVLRNQVEIIKKTTGVYSIKFLPHTIIIDKKGVVRHSSNDFLNKSAEEMSQFIEDILKEGGK